MIRAIFQDKSARELEKANLDGHIRVTSLCIYILYVYIHIQNHCEGKGIYKDVYPRYI